MGQLSLELADALVIVDVQNDFLPGSALAVEQGNEILPALSACIDLFHQKGLPIFASRDWHPASHCSFLPQGGIWPPHCLAGTSGAAFPEGLKLPDTAIVVSRAVNADQDAYSAFQGTHLADDLRRDRKNRLL